MSYTHSSTASKVVIGAAHSRGHARSMAPRSMAEAFGPHARLTERAERNADRIVGWACAAAAATVAIGLLTGLIP